MKVGIIGAGAVGLMLATKLEKLNIDYMIFNKGKVGRKILASGNGRCNIANKNFTPLAYHNNPLAIKIVKNNQNELFDYFKELHIYTKEDSEGRMYPISESSLSVLNILMSNITKKVCDIEVNSIKKYKEKYYVNEGYGPFDKIVLATGSIASFKRPYNSYDYLDTLSIKYNEFKPSLVGFMTNRKVKPISGCRQKSIVKLYQNDKLIHEEEGEVIFKDNGLSGIVIMNMSSYYNQLKNKLNCYLIIDLSKEDYDDYSSVINPKILEYVNSNHISIHSFKIPIIGLYDMEFAQVAKGGIDTNLVTDTLKLKDDNNIFIGGELLDCDAICGGYNLMFAFCSSLVIAKELKNEI